MTTTVKLYSLSFTQHKTYLFAALFIVGNLLLPQLCHLTPMGGNVLLPIYFFTLIAAYKYGLKVGLLTAILSPLANSLLFGMPTLAVLPIILIKSALLATFAAVAASQFKKISFVGILLAVIAYQVIGAGFEWVITQNFTIATEAVRLALPGMAIQLVGGYALLKAIAKV